jgi:hypothetical protein
MAADFRINNLIAQGGSFTERPTVNGTGVLLEGDSTTGSFLTTGTADLRYVEIADLPVYQTGNQTISGTKTFHSGLLVQNGNVGIGTLTPTSKLEVVGDSKISGNLNITNYNTGVNALDRFTIDGAAGRLFGVSDSVTGTIFSVNDAAGLPIIEVESNLTDKITMGTYGSNALVVNDTKVGIGTATPSGKLEVIGDTKISGNLIFTDGGTRTISGASATVAGAGTSLNIRGGNANTAGVGGSINLIPGIGAGGPGNGDINIGSSTLGIAQAISLYAPTTTINYTGPNLGTPLIINGGGRELMSFNWDNINNVTSLKSSSSSSIRLSGALDYQIMGSTPTSSRAALNVVNSNNSSIAYFRNDNKVGIGTTSPAGKLHIEGSLTSTPGSTDSSIMLGQAGTTYGAIRLSTDGSFNIDSNVGTWQTTPSLTILRSSQNVGIGVASPLSKLTVNGNILLGTGNMLAPGINLNATDGYNTIGFGSPGSWFMGINGSTGNESINITDANSTWPGTPRVTFLRGGNVGIGTATPTQKLDVVGGSARVSGPNSVGLTLNKINSTNTAALYFTEADALKATIQTDTLGNFLIDGPNSVTTRLSAANSATLALVAGGSSTITFSTNGFERMRVLSNGNVSIGTTTPTSNFQVTQPTTGDGTISIAAGGTTVTGVQTKFLNTFKIGDTITSAGQTLAISAIASDTSMTTSAAGAAISGASYTLAGGTILRVLGNGRVGIGVTNPAAPLDVYYTHGINGGTQYGFQSIINGGSNNLNIAAYFSATAGSGQLAIKTGNGGIDFNGTLTTNGNIIRSGNIFITAIPSSTQGNLQIGDATSNFAAGGGGVLTFSGDTLGQVGFGDLAVFASIRGIKENNSYQNSLGALTFGTQSTATFASKLPTITEKMRILSNGNVGIGTTVPTANFEVVQPTVGVGTISIGVSGTTVTGIDTQFLNTFKAGNTITASGQTLTISSIASNTLMTTSVAVSGVSGAPYSLVGGSRFRVYGNGDMTLGSTSVAERTANIDGVNANRLQVGGNFGFGGGGLAVRTSTINSSSRLVVASANNLSATSAYLLGTDGLQRDKGLIYDNSGEYISLVNGSNINSDSYTRRLTVALNGNVGIGTTTPTEKLDVIGNAKISASLSTNTLGVSGASVFNSSAAFTVRPTVNSSGVLLEGELSTGAFLTTGAADLRYVATGATGSFLTTGAANLQYVEFTDLPVYQTGNQTISGIKTFATGLKIGVGNSIETPNGGQITWGLMNGAGGDTLKFTGFNDNIFFNNNVSIGANRLVGQGGYIESKSSVGANNIPGMLFAASQGSDPGNPVFRFWDTSSYTDHRLFSVGGGSTYADFMTVRSNGNVGIGTATPTQKLDVVGGNVKISGPASTALYIDKQGTGFASSINFQITGVNGPSIQHNSAGDFIIGGSNSSTTALAAGNSATLSLSAASNSTIQFSTAGSERMRVSSNGNVGIGITSPAATLDVRDITLAGSASLAGSALNIAQTWNTSGTPTAIKLNVTDTLSNTASKLLDLQLTGYSRLNLSKAGILTISDTDTANRQAAVKIIQSDRNVNLIPGAFGGNANGLAGPSFYQASAQDGSLAFSANNYNGTVSFFRLFNDNVSDTIAQRNGSAPQESRIYGTYTNATNFERLNLKYNSTDSAFQIGTEKGVSGSARPLQLQTDGATRMALATDGKIGIGTASPTNLLHIYSEAGNGVAQLLVQNDTDTAVPMMQLLRRRASGAAVAQHNSLGRISALGAKSSSVNLQAGYIEFQANGSPAGFNNVLPSKINFVTLIDDTYANYTNSIINGAFVAGGSGGQFIFNKNDNIGGDYVPDVGISRLGVGKIAIGNATAGTSTGTLIAGNVGIGTTNPLYPLHVLGSNATQVIRARIENSTGPAIIQVQAGASKVASFSLSNSVVWDAGVDTDQKFKIAGPNGDVAQLSTNTRLTIDSLGNIGIGTTTATSNFQVTQPGIGAGVISVGAGGTTVSGIGTQFLNTFKIGDTITSAGQSLIISAIASDTSMTTSAAGAAISGAAYTLVGRNVLSVKGNGSVGIGTDIPAAKLQINNKVGDSAGFVYDSDCLLVTHQTPTATATLNDPKTVLVLARQGTSSQAFGAGAAFNLSRFENSGTNSRTRLDISLANGSFDLNSNTVITMLSNGNVGIGRTAPLAKLDVNGTAFINATGDGGTGAKLTVGGTGSTIYTPGSVWATGGLVLSVGNSVSQVTVNGSNIVNVGGLQIANGGPVLSYASSTGIKVLQANGITYGSVNAGTLALGSTYAGTTTPANGAIIEGNVGIGTNTPSEKLEVAGNAKVSGHFSAATKSFLIPHPTKAGKQLQYGVVESDQHSVLVRGKTSKAIIELPEEWVGLVHEDSVTVQLTPIGSYQQLFVVSQDNQKIVVGGSTGEYNYTVYGERKDVDKLITEI